MMDTPNLLQIDRGFYIDRLSETERQTDREITNRCLCWAPFGNKAGEWEKKERDREEYKYRMMQWSNDVRGREQGGREADRLCFINSVLWNRSS